MDFNDIRTTLQALCAIYDNCNSGQLAAQLLIGGCRIGGVDGQQRAGGHRAGGAAVAARAGASSTAAHQRAPHPGRRPCRGTPRQNRPPLRSSKRLPGTSVSLPGITLSDEAGQGERARTRRSNRTTR
jgi:hypothetical protein